MNTISSKQCASSTACKSLSAPARPCNSRKLRQSATTVQAIAPAPRTNDAASLRVQKVAAQKRRAAVVAAAGASATPTNGVYDVVIVGAGISGMVTAQALSAKHGSKVSSFLVTEARERVGGNITSMASDEYVWEEGPNSFQPNDSMLQIAVDAGVDKDLVFGDPKAPRFVFWENKLRATPSGPDALTFDLLTIFGKIRAGLGAVGIYKSGPMPESEESVEQFIRRNLGAEVFERLIEPFCSGVYAGDPSKLSMQAAFNRIWILEKKGGSLVGGAIKLFQDRKANPPPPRDPRLPAKPKGQTVGSFRQGLKMLPEAIERNIKDSIRVNWKLQNIAKTESGDYQLTYDTPEGTKQIMTRQVALTIPAYTAADLLQKQCPAAHDALKSFDYPPVGAVTLSYPESAIREDRKDAAGKVPGFGQLHPRSQGITTLGTIYSSSLFPGRAPDGSMLILNYIGGATNRGIVDQTHEQLVEQVDKDLRVMLLKPDAPKPKTVGVRVWPRAIPQFNLGHLEKLDVARNSLQQAGWDNVILGGNYVAGVALGKCVEYGYEMAEDIAKRAAAQPAVKTPAAV